MTLRNTLWHCALHPDITQHHATHLGCTTLKKTRVFFRGLDIKIYSVLDGSLTPKEGLQTFACKSKNADRQDWYIYCRIGCPCWAYIVFTMRLVSVTESIESVHRSAGILSFIPGLYHIFFEGVHVSVFSIAFQNQYSPGLTCGINIVKPRFLFQTVYQWSYIMPIDRYSHTL